MNLLRSSLGPLQWGVITLCGVLGLSALLWAAQFMGDTTPKLRGQAVITELKKGGHVLFFRHGLTSNFGEKDVVDQDLGNCAIQRNLSEEGQAQTKAIGAAFRTLQIPIGEVYASPYCRCRDTANNIFGRAPKSTALHFSVHLESRQRVAVTEQLLDLLGTLPPPGTNAALVSHAANLQDAVGIWPRHEGVAHIFKPDGAGHFSHVGMMRPEAWLQEAALVADVARHPGQQGWLYTLKRWFRHLF